MARKKAGAEAPQAQEAPVKFTKEVEMSAQETASLLKNLSAAEREKQDLQAKRKDYNAAKRVQLNDVQARIDTLLEQEETGKKKVVVDATAVFDYAKAVVITKENSSGKVLEKRDMTVKERQTDLTGPHPENEDTGDGGEPAEDEGTPPEPEDE